MLSTIPSTPVRTKLAKNNTAFVMPLVNHHSARETMLKLCSVCFVTSSLLCDAHTKTLVRAGGCRQVDELGRTLHTAVTLCNTQ